MLHVPEDYRDAVEASIIKFISKYTGEENFGRALHFQRAPAPGTLAKYLCKGITPDDAKDCYIDAEDQGVIYGGRISVSRSLGRSARKAAGWTTRADNAW
jgi:hypothetical protein